VFITDLEARRLQLFDRRTERPYPRFFRASIIPKTDIRLSGPVFLEDGNVAFGALGPSGLRFKLQSTTDLVAWEDVAEFTFSSREIRIVDDQVAERGPKIYRIILTGKAD